MNIYHIIAISTGDRRISSVNSSNVGFSKECIDGVPPPTIAQDGMVIAPVQPSRVLLDMQKRSRGGPRPQGIENGEILRSTI